MKKSTLVIGYKEVEENSKNKVGNPPIETNIQNQEQVGSQKNCFTKKCLFISLGISSLILIGIIIAIVLVTDRDKGKKTKEEDPPFIIIPPEEKEKMIETEFEFNTKVGDLNRINVVQKYSEEIITNGIKTFQNVFRETNYDIFFISETNSTEETKYFYNKTYLAAIIISSQCIDTKNENCEPESLINLREIKKQNLRYLDEIPDLKDIPLPICLFNITNNDVITSITCPESLQNIIRRNMLLDLYFFRPPAIIRPDKENNNVTITKIKKDGNEYIREINGGLCNIPGSYESFCTTEMNTTVDKEGHIIKYDEEAFTNITHDINNIYIKDKITNLKDETININDIDKENYKEILNKLIEKLKPYLKYYEQFTIEEFKELYDITKNNTNNKILRNLQENEENNLYIEQSLFNYTHYTDTQLFITLKNEPGYDSESMKAMVNLLINDENKEILSLKEPINFALVKNLFKDLSIAGNDMANELYNKIKLDFDYINLAVSNNITNLINLIVDENKKSLSAIFDSISNMEKLKIFPMSLVEESTNLKQKLNNVLDTIKNGGMKSKISFLNENITNFIIKSHKLVDNVFQNIRTLSKLLKTSKSKLTEISTYYLNNTPNSFYDIIEDSKTLLLNYYKDEENIIFSDIDSLINNFNKNLNKSIEIEQLKIDNLLEKLENENFTIENGNEEDKNLLINNLKDSKEIINSIILKVEELIRREMNLKENGHFISDYDISSTNNSFYPDIEEALKTSKILDNDETIDKNFDKTYKDVKENYTKLMKLNRKNIEEQMPFLDNILENSLFSENNKKSLENNISYSSLKIINSIRNENDDYLKLANGKINDFLEKNNETLNELIINLTAAFSEDTLIYLTDLYEQAFDSCLQLLNKNIEKNKNLANNYFQKLLELFQDDNKIVELLRYFETDPSHLPRYVDGRPLTSFQDTITKKSKTQIYLNKYKRFKEEVESSKEYINDLMTIDFKFEYKMVITKLKDLLQILKNSKLNDKFKNFEELKFIDNNIQQIDGFYNIINKHFSDKNFNEKYIPRINNYKPDTINKINEIETNVIESYHQKINQYGTVNDFNNDFCFAFSRKKTYTCPNGAITTKTSTSNYCEIMGDNTNNYKLLTSLSIYSDEKLQKFMKYFQMFYSKLDTIVISYTNIINELGSKLYIFEEQAITNSSTTDFYQDYKILINNILSDNYGNNIILSTYNYYQKDIEERVNTIFNELIIGWKNFFLNFYDEVNNNINEYQKSITEFGIISKIYYEYILGNISENYYDLIMNHEKNEFNYTLIYYYNYLKRLIISERQNIINKMPINKIGFERVLEQRKNEVNQLFDELLETIENSQNNALSFYNQLYLLQVPSTNFFNISNILTNLRKKIKNNCENIADEIFYLDNAQNNDMYSYISRYYLENCENGRQIKAFFEEIENSNFIYLETVKFKESLTKNWIFDQNDFINSLNNTFIENNIEISNELALNIEVYKKILENELIKYSPFIKDNIIAKISNIYKGGILELKEIDIQKVNEDIKEIVKEILLYLSKEKERLAQSSIEYYNDYTLINQTIKEYKDKIIAKLNNKIYNFTNDFRNYIENEVYINYYQKYLNIYLNEIKSETESYEEIKLLNSSYHIGLIIDNIAKGLSMEYGDKTKAQIIHKAEEYIELIQFTLNFDEMQKYIDSEINKGYMDLYENLKTKLIVDNTLFGFNKYDLSDEIKSDLDNLIQKKYDNFSDIIEKLKGEKYKNIDIKNITEWEIPDFSKISNIVKNIKDLFDSFIIPEKNDEEEKVNTFVNRVIISNFNELLNNLIPSFGNQFFERIIAYNKNFKLSNLFNNLKWMIAESNSYIEILDFFNNINQITKDLKIKIYRMNDLDSKILQNNQKIISLLYIKSNEFIFDTRNYVLQQYSDFIINDASIGMAFDESIQKVIKNIFQKSMNEIEKEYDILMEKYLKDKLISSYKQILDENTESILKTINNQREYLKNILDDIPSIDSDDVLNEINNQINSTLEALIEYNNNLNGFKISEELIEYLNNYGNIEISPSYKNFENVLNQIYKDVIVLNLDRNSEDYENTYNFNEFIEITNKTYDEIKGNYINEINESSISYYENYTGKLDQKINHLNLRRLDETGDIYERKVADKSLDEIFHKLLNNSLQIKMFIQSLELFEEFDKKISNSKISLITAYKKAKTLIIDNNYEEEIRITLENRLMNLTNYSLEYYSLINESFYNLKTYLNTSISKLNDLLNNCANITYEIFEKKYSEYLNKVTPVNEEKKEDDTLDYEKEVIIQNYHISVKALSESIQKEAIFQYDYEYDIIEENGIKIPKLKTNLINLSHPRALKIQLIKPITACANEIEEIDIVFNNANYSVSLDFSPNSEDIISTISTLFEDYEYTVERYNTTDNSEPVCIGDGVNTNRICFKPKCSNARDQQIIPKRKFIIDKKQSKEIVSIPE